MGAILGVVIGYRLGTSAGEQGWTELVRAWKVIQSSSEVRDLLSGGLSIVRGMLGRSGEALAGALGGGAPESTLRQVA